MGLFRCPVCGLELERIDKIYRCAGGHCYDRAKEGYVNLSPQKPGRSKTQGDGAAMVEARASFLAGGYYQPLRDAMGNAAAEELQGIPSPAFVDAGCGEGYYTEGIHRCLENAGMRPGTAGFDLSRYALRRAAKRMPYAEFAVVSLFSMPVADSAADLVTDIFAPISPVEFGRVLRENGTLMLAVPGRRHLWGLKELLYDSPYLNDGEQPEHEGFVIKRRLEIRYNVLLRSRDDAANLFAMTPYFWKTSKEGAARLDTVDSLETPVEFDVYIMKKA